MRPAFVPVLLLLLALFSPLPAAAQQNPLLGGQAPASQEEAPAAADNGLVHRLEGFVIAAQAYFMRAIDRQLVAIRDGHGLPVVLGGLAIAFLYGVFHALGPGHGKTIIADGDYYFIPPSMEGFSDAEIKAQGFGPAKLSSWFKNIQAEKSIWIFDACDSGSAGSVFRVRDATADDAAYLRLKDATGRTLFMAAGPQQVATEGYHNHGLFTFALLEGLAKAGHDDKVQLYDLAGYVQTRVPDLSRELSVCDAKGPREYCQKPIVRLGETPNYPLAPRYPQVLAMLNEGAATDAILIPLKPTHVVMQQTALLESRGAGSSRQIEVGEQVTLIKIDADLAQIAQGGKLLGYVDKSKLLKLR